VSLAEIKKELPKMSLTERLELASFLASLNASDPEYEAELSRRFGRMDRGEKITSEQLYKLHDELISKGK
jgi:hypothetical protein